MKRHLSLAFRRLLAALLLAPSPSSAAVARARRAIEPAEPAPVPAPLSSSVQESSAPAPGLSAAPLSGSAAVCGTEERRELDRLSALVQLEQQKNLQRLRPVSEEREEAAARNALLTEKQRTDLSPLEFELRRLQLENQIADEKAKKASAAQRARRDGLHVDNDVARELLAARQVQAEEEKLRSEAALRELEVQGRRLRIEAEMAESKVVGLKTDLDLREKKEKWRLEANRDPDYIADPFQDGILTISDRRIPLNGAIMPGAAAYVNDRIDYFNNKDPNLPIFIVIDQSPGGSVMQGYRIVRAMRESRAPVYVVVKSFAASMAAVITTLAKRSYAYPNAVILHHELSSFSFGNLTQQKEHVERMKRWYRRLAEPVAGKMGLSLDKFTAEMYAHNSDGDWDEFADEAVRLKWVDHVVREVRETGTLKEPADRRKSWREDLYGGVEETDAQGNRFVRLPRLEPYDAWWVYNRDGYYR